MPVFMICSTLLAVIVVAYYILKKYNPIFVFFFQILSCLFLLFISQEHLYQSSKQRVYKLLNVLLDSYLLSQQLLKVSFLEQGLLS